MILFFDKLYWAGYDFAFFKTILVVKLKVLTSMANREWPWTLKPHLTIPNPENNNNNNQKDACRNGCNYDPRS